MRNLLLLLIPVLVSCVNRVPMPNGPPHPVSYKLLSNTPEAETSTRTEQRQDVWVRTDQFSHIPVVVAKGEAGPLSLQGGRAQICGDETCSKGIGVDNFILFEVLDATGAVKHRFIIGFDTGVSVDNQEPDNVGASAFNFDHPLDVTQQLPADAKFTLRATALDYGGVGRVSDVYLRVSPVAERTPSDDDLYNH